MTKTSENYEDKLYEYGQARERLSQVERLLTLIPPWIDDSTPEIRKGLERLRLEHHRRQYYLSCRLEAALSKDPQ